MLLGIHGKKRSGKDTVGQYLENKYGFNKHAFANKLRELALGINPIVYTTSDDYIKLYDFINVYGYEEAKKQQDIREFYQDLGIAVRKTFGKDFWVDELWKVLIKKYDTYDSAVSEPDEFKSLVLPNIQSNVVITDVRFENEAQRIRDYSGYIIHLIGRGEEGDEHISEKPLPPQFTQFALDNSGTEEELFEKVDNILRSLKFNKIK